MTKEDKNLDSFFLSFVGQRIIITTNLVQSFSHSLEGQQILETSPMQYEGILLDYDEEYYYLGKVNKEDEIQQAIKKVHVAHISCVEESDMYQEILKQVPGPERKEDIN
jgi:hypothetical protein